MAKYLDGQGLGILWNKISQFMFSALDVTSEELDKKTDNFQISKIKDYLYETYYDDINYEYAKEYFESRSPRVEAFACSSFRRGNYFARNFDWTYNTDADFVVKTKARKGRHAVLGVASGVSELSNDVASTGEWNSAYKILPFMLVDGINDKGVVCNINVVPIDVADPAGFYRTTVTTPAIEEKEKICNIMIVRYILDNFSTAAEAVNYIKNYVTLYTPQSLIDMGYTIHAMVSDENDNYIIEGIMDEVHILKLNEDGTYEEGGYPGLENVLKYPAMTNFYLAFATPGSDGKYATQFDNKIAMDEIGAYSLEDLPEGFNLPTNANSVSPLGSGLERYNIMIDLFQNDRVREYDIINTITNKLKYTNTYSYLSDETKVNDIWYSEFVGPAYNDDSTPKLDEFDNPIYVTNYTPIDNNDLTNMIGRASLAYLNTRVRTPEEADYQQKKFYGTWQTTHSSIYNIKDRTLNIYVQEEPDVKYFEGEMYYTQADINRMLAEIQPQDK